MKRQLHVYLLCLLIPSLFATNGWGQTAFTITYTGLGGSTAAVPSPSTLFTVALTNTTAYNGIDASCATSTDSKTSYTTTIAAKAGYNFSITSITGTAYASNAGLKGYQFQITSSNSNFTTASSTVTSISSSSNCTGTSSIGSLTGSFITTDGNSCTINVFKTKTGAESGGGYSKTKTIVISGTYTAIVTAVAPTVTTTSPITSITATAATGIGGNVTNDGGAAITERGIVYATFANPTTANTKVTAIGTTGAYTASIVSGLTSSTTYNVRAYAINSINTSYGNNVSFTTASAASDHFRSNASGNWSSTSTWESSSDSVNWINATLTPTSSANTISILATHTVTVDANISVSNTNIAATGALNVAPGIVLTIPSDKTVINSGTFALKSDNTGTGSIGSSVGKVTGDATIERFIPGGLRAFRFLCNPFTTAMPLTQLTDSIDITGNGADAATPPFAVTGTNAPSAFSYDPTITDAGTVTTIGSGSSAPSDPGWVPYTTAAGTVGVGDGFRVLIRGSKGQPGSLTSGTYTPADVTLSATGTLNATGNFTKTIAYSAGNLSLNLIGNPYPSNVNLNTVTPGTGANNNFWIFSPHQGTKGGYLTYAFGTNDYSLPTFTGFIVQAIDGTGNTITFHEADKTDTDTSSVLRNTNGHRNIVEMSINSGNIFWDRFMLQLDKKGSANFDAKWDAGKFANSEVSFYSLTNERKELAIDVRPFEAGKSIPLGFVSNAARSYTLTVNSYELEDGFSLYLLDKYLGTETKVEEGMAYQFSTNAGAATQGENRFELVQKQNLIVLPVPVASKFSIKLSPNPVKDMLKVDFSNEEKATTSITVMNAEGKTVKTINAGNVQSGQIMINVKGLAKGSYYVTLNNGTEKKTEKLQVQ